MSCPDYYLYNDFYYAPFIPICFEIEPDTGPSDISSYLVDHIHVLFRKDDKHTDYPYKKIKKEKKGTVLFFAASESAEDLMDTTSCYLLNKFYKLTLFSKPANIKDCPSTLDILSIVKGFHI